MMFRIRLRAVALTLSLLLAPATAFAAQCTASASPGLTGLPHPVLFVTQFPIANDFATIGSTFGNHRTTMGTVARGGDLYILYPDGQLCNLTREAGFGEAANFQGAEAIAVRDPHVHWDGDRALFSMVLGAPTQQFQQIEVFWQIYEVTGLAQGAALTITQIANQPSDYNNITPVYSPDGRILFTSDRPRDGRRHLYPQNDEYESTATNTGLYSLDPTTGDLRLLDHAPSGVFSPMVDSYGRVLFTRWDHLQRDQQADGAGNPNDAFNWLSEEANAPTTGPVEVFPEPRVNPPPGVSGHRFNHFFPWMIHPDGTEAETLNHIGRHELHEYFAQSFTGDPSLEEFIDSISGRVNGNAIENLFQMAEDPQNPGTYFGVDAPEFQTHASGMIVRLSLPPGQAPDQVPVTYVTHPDTRTVVGDGDSPPGTHSGHYRDPRPLSDGTLVAAHTFETRGAGNEGTLTSPDPRYDFRLRTLTLSGAHLEASATLTQGLNRQIEFWNPDQMVTYDGPLWELQPVEVRSRPTPPLLESSLPSPESQVFAEEGVNLEDFRAYLRQRELALVVSRDVTIRDSHDVQQPFNLAIPGGTQTTGDAGTVYDVQHMQFFQGDQVRGLGGAANPRAGRRVLAVPMHDGVEENPPTNGPEGSVNLELDGSMAAFVPAHRAMTWQLVDPQGDPVVRERYWLTFQAGEVRVCASCHGLSSTSQAGGDEPVQAPEALRQLLRFWKSQQILFNDSFESGDLTAWSTSSGE